MTVQDVGATFFTVTYVEAVTAAAAPVAALLQQYRDRTRGEALRLDVLQRLDRPSHFTVLASWRDEAAFEEHLASRHVASLDRELDGLLAAPNDTRRHSGLALGDSIAGGSASLTAVTHVDVVPQHKDETMASLGQLASKSRTHPGNLRFDVWQQTNRLNHFTVVEAWSRRRAFDAHGMAADTRDFRTRLAVMAGALYDERLYRPLV